MSMTSSLRQARDSLLLAPRKSGCCALPKCKCVWLTLASSWSGTTSDPRRKGASAMPRSRRHGQLPRRQLAIVVPLFNEVGTIDELHTRLSAVLRLLGRSSEVIYVDDGSTDGTAEAVAA